MLSLKTIFKMNEGFYQDITEHLSRLQADGMLRSLRAGDYGLPCLFRQGEEYLNLSANDYLGIANDRELVREFLGQEGDMRFGSTGSRLMTGNTTAYRDFEEELERTYGRAALVFGSGYQANTGILPGLAGAGDLIVADKLVHASIIDGVLSSKADFLRFRHNDCGHLENILEKNRERYRNVWIVTESIFSMDGDRSDVCRLAGIRDKYDSLLYIDEAHSIGTDGEKGLGVCREKRILERTDIAVYPMGKGMASHGAFVLCRPEVKEYLVNVSRPFIFSTALPPVCVRWCAFVFNRMQGMDGRRKRLKQSSSLLREELEKEGFNVLGNSHIIPVVFGENTAVLAAADGLRKQGIWATAIRHPTVPKGQARIRLSLSSVFSPGEIGRVVEAFKKLKK